MDGREARVCICLPFFCVLFPSGQCLNQRSSLCFWVIAPGPCSGHLASQISNTNMKCYIDPEIAGDAKTQRV